MNQEHRIPPTHTHTHTHHQTRTASYVTWPRIIRIKVAPLQGPAPLPLQEASLELPRRGAVRSLPATQPQSSRYPTIFAP